MFTSEKEQAEDKKKSFLIGGKQNTQQRVSVLFRLAYSAFNNATSLANCSPRGNVICSDGDAALTSWSPIFASELWIPSRGSSCVGYKHSQLASPAQPQPLSTQSLHTLENRMQTWKISNNGKSLGLAGRKEIYGMKHMQ